MSSEISPLTGITADNQKLIDEHIYDYFSSKEKDDALSFQLKKTVHVTKRVLETHDGSIFVTGMLSCISAFCMIPAFLFNHSLCMSSSCESQVSPSDGCSTIADCQRQVVLGIIGSALMSLTCSGCACWIGSRSDRTCS